MTPILSDIGPQEVQVWTVVFAHGTGLAHLGVAIETDREACLGKRACTQRTLSTGFSAQGVGWQ